MADVPASLAQAVARITELESELLQANEAAAQARSERDAARTQLQAAQTQASSDPVLQSRIAELERLLSPPPAGSGIVTVSYDDGAGRTWKKYAAPDGTKHMLAADALHRADVLYVMGADVPEVYAERIVQHRVQRS